jgi:predicted phage terminase large subunit-like protein
MVRRKNTQESRDSDPIARAIELELVRREAKSLPLDFAAFVEAAWPHVEAFPFRGGMHIDAICEHLQAAGERRIKSLVINMPPRAGKSTLCSVLFPAWLLARSPREELLFASYSASLATRDSVKTRTLIESDWYQERFPHVKLRDDQNLKTSFTTTQGGGRQMTSVGGTVTGLGGSFLILDDPLNAKEGESPVALETANVWFRESWYNRAAGDPEQTVRIVVMQRLHSNDVSAQAIEMGWELLCLPMEFEEASEPTSLGWVDPRTEFGQLLWPEMYGPATVAKLKKAQGPYAFAGQYQQRPSPRGGGVIKKTWLRFWYDPALGVPEPIKVQNDAGEWETLPQYPFVLPKYPQITASWDLSFKGGAKNDAVVGQAWATQGPNFVLVDQVRDRMDFPQTKAAVRKQAADWRPMPTYIEEKANGAAIIAELRQEIPGIIPVTPMGDKYSRLAAVSALFEAGNVWLPHPHQKPWVDHAIEEITVFPKFPTDDVVDCASQALAHMRQRDCGPVDLGSGMGGAADVGVSFEVESYWV